MPGFRVAWAPTSDGFGAVVPVSGQRLLAAVGRVFADGLPPGGEPARDGIRSVIEDHALVEGYDARALLHRCNVDLLRLRLGRLDAVALVNGAVAGMPASVSGAGSPAPLVVTADRLSAPAGDGVPLAEGWAVVLGSELTHADPFSNLLSPDDVRRALALLDGPGAPAVGASRTMLAVGIAGGR